MKGYKFLLGFLLLLGCFSVNNISNTPVNQVYAQESLTPQQVFQSYTDAQSNGNLDEYRKYISQSLYKQTETPDAEAMFKKLAAMMLVKNIKITGNNISGDTAILKATGNIPMSNSFADGTITIVKENGQWKVKSEEWISKDGNSTQRFSVGIKK